MTPFGAFPGHGAFTLQGLNTRNHNGTEGRPQTTAAVAAAGDKKHGRPFKWIYTGGLDFTEDYLTEEVTDHKQRAKAVSYGEREILSGKSVLLHTPWSKASKVARERRR